MSPTTVASLYLALSVAATALIAVAFGWLMYSTRRWVKPKARVLRDGILPLALMLWVSWLLFDFQYDNLKLGAVSFPCRSCGGTKIDAMQSPILAALLVLISGVPAVLIAGGSLGAFFGTFLPRADEA